MNGKGLEGGCHRDVFVCTMKAFTLTSERKHTTFLSKEIWKSEWDLNWVHHEYNSKTSLPHQSAR
jgi:hypothetical protein